MRVQKVDPAPNRDLKTERLVPDIAVFGGEWVGVGSLIGGWLPSQFAKRRTATAASRFEMMLGCAVLMPLSLFIAHVTGLTSP